MPFFAIGKYHFYHPLLVLFSSRHTNSKNISNECLTNFIGKLLLELCIYGITFWFIRIVYRLLFLSLSAIHRIHQQQWRRGTTLRNGWGKCILYGGTLFRCLCTYCTCKGINITVRCANAIKNDKNCLYFFHVALLSEYGACSLSISISASKSLLICALCLWGKFLRLFLLLLRMTFFIGCGAYFPYRCLLCARIS